jgi:hypothetical protein
MRGEERIHSAQRIKRMAKGRRERGTTSGAHAADTDSIRHPSSQSCGLSDWTVVEFGEAGPDGHAGEAGLAGASWSAAPVSASGKIRARLPHPHRSAPAASDTIQLKPSHLAAFISNSHHHACQHPLRNRSGVRRSSHSTTESVHRHSSMSALTPTRTVSDQPRRV